MTRFRLYFDKDKELEWLNQMVQEGYAMESFFAGFYTFVPCEKGEWQYQIDIGNGFFHSNKAFSDFMDEMDIQIVQNWGPWVILRRKTQEGPFQLYSDVDGRIAQYRRILLMFKIVTGIELFALLYMLYAGISGISLGWPLALLVGAVVCVFINMIVQTKERIEKLKELKGEGNGLYGKRTVSMAVPAGLFLNSANLLLGEHIPNPIRLVLSVIALAIIIYGAFRTARRRA